MYERGARSPYGQSTTRSSKKTYSTYTIPNRFSGSYPVNRLKRCIRHVAESFLHYHKDGVVEWITNYSPLHEYWMTFRVSSTILVVNRSLRVVETNTSRISDWVYSVFQFSLAQRSVFVRNPQLSRGLRGFSRPKSSSSPIPPTVHPVRTLFRRLTVFVAWVQSLVVGHSLVLDQYCLVVSNRPSVSSSPLLVSVKLGFWPNYHFSFVPPSVHFSFQSLFRSPQFVLTLSQWRPIGL